MDRFLTAKVASVLRLDEDEAEELDPEPPPILYTYPIDYALSTWQDHQRDGSSWPEGTCYNDQDPQLIMFWDSLTARYNWLFDQAQRAQKDADEFSKLHKSGGPRQSLDSLFGD